MLHSSVYGGTGGRSGVQGGARAVYRGVYRVCHMGAIQGVKWDMEFNNNLIIESCKGPVGRSGHDLIINLKTNARTCPS